MSCCRRCCARWALHKPPWLLGHSDGGSIALLHAARFPDAVAGLVVMAPHLFVEDVSVASIQRTREVFGSTDLPQRLARHHDDVDSAFWGWNDIWLDPAFRAGTSRPRFRPSAARCWPSRAWTTNTARWNRSAASDSACRRRGCWSWPTVAIRRTATSPKR